MMRKRLKMKISTTKIRQIIKEELQRVLGEASDDQATTIYGPRAGKKLAGKSAGRFVGTGASYDPDKTQEVDVAAAIKQEQESPAAPTFRDEARRLFNIFFVDYDDDALETLVHNDPELEEILAKLYGWNLDLFPHDVQPSPTIVKIAGQFEKEGKGIIDNEAEFLKRVEEDLYAVGLRDFATTGAGSEEDLAQIQSRRAAQLRSAAETFAVDEVVKILKDEQAEKYADLPRIAHATDAEIRQLMRDVPQVEPELFKQAYDWYIKNRT